MIIKTNSFKNRKNYKDSQKERNFEGCFYAIGPTLKKKNYLDFNRVMPFLSWEQHSLLKCVISQIFFLVFSLLNIVFGMNVLFKKKKTTPNKQNLKFSCRNSCSLLSYSYIFTLFHCNLILLN